MKRIFQTLPLILLPLALADCSGAQNTQKPAPSSTPTGQVLLNTEQTMPVQTAVGKSALWSYTLTNQTPDTVDLQLTLSKGPVASSTSTDPHNPLPTCSNTLSPGQSCRYTVEYSSSIANAPQTLSGSYTQQGHVLTTTPAQQTISVQPFTPSLTVDMPTALTDNVKNAASVVLNFENDHTKTTRDVISNIAVDIADQPASLTVTENKCVGASLSPGQSCKITYAFLPTSQADAKTYDFSISYAEDNQAQTPLTEKLTTTVVEPEGTVLVTSEQPMPIQAAVGTKISWSYTITNETNAALDHLKFELSKGPVTEQVLTLKARDDNDLPRCGDTLAEKASCRYTVEYEPNQSESFSQTLIGHYQQLGQSLSTDPINIDGSGYTSALKITVNANKDVTTILNQPYDFPITLENDSPENETNTITNMSIAIQDQPTSLQITKDDCIGMTLARGESCTATARFLPATPDDAKTYTFLVNDDENGQAQAAMTATVNTHLAGPEGSVLLRSSQAMPVQTAVGKSVQWSYTITNETNDAIEGLSLTLSPGPVVAIDAAPTDANPLPSCTSALAQGASCQYTVQYTGSTEPSSEQTLSGHYNARGENNLPTQPENTAISTQPFTTGLAATVNASPTAAIQNTTPFTLTLSNNSTDKTDSITQLDVSLQPDSSAITVTDNSCTNATLMAGQSCTILYAFTPRTLSDAATYTFSINYQENNQSQTPLTQTVTTVVASDTVSLTTDTSKLPLITTVGNSIQSVLTVNNTSNDTITGLTLTGNNNTDFNIAPSSTCSATTPLKPMSACWYNLNYTPSQADDTEDDLSLTADQITTPVTLKIPAHVDYGSASMPTSAEVSASAGGSTTFNLLVTPTLFLGDDLPHQQATYPTLFLSLNAANIAGSDHQFNYANGSFPGLTTTTSDPIPACPTPNGDDQVRLTQPCLIALTFVPTDSSGTTNFPLAFQFASGPNQTHLFSRTVAISGTVVPTGKPVIQPTPASCTFVNFVKGSSVSNCTYIIENQTPGSSDTISFEGIPLVAPLAFQNESCATQNVIGENENCTFSVGYFPQGLSDQSGPQMISVDYGPSLSTPYPIYYNLADTHLQAQTTDTTLTAAGTPLTASTDLSLQADNPNYQLVLDTDHPITAGEGNPSTVHYALLMNDCPVGILTTPSCHVRLVITLDAPIESPITVYPTLNYHHEFSDSELRNQSVSLPLTINPSPAVTVSFTPSTQQTVHTALNQPVSVTFTLSVAKPSDASPVVIHDVTGCSGPINIAAPGEDNTCSHSTLNKENPSCFVKVTYLPQSLADDGISCALTANYTANDVTQNTDASGNVSGEIKHATLSVTPDYTLFDTSGHPLPTAAISTSVIRNQLFSEPNQTVVMRLAVMPDATYGAEFPAILNPDPLSGLPDAFKDVTLTISPNVNDACPENGQPIPPASTPNAPSCFIYLSFTGPNAFGANQVWPKTGQLRLNYTSHDTPTESAPIQLTTSTNVLYALTDQGLLALSPADGALLNTHNPVDAQGTPLFGGILGVTHSTGIRILPASFVIDPEPLANPSSHSTTKALYYIGTACQAVGSGTVESCKTDHAQYALFQGSENVGHPDTLGPADGIPQPNSTYSDQTTAIVTQLALLNNTVHDGGRQIYLTWDKLENNGALLGDLSPLHSTANVGVFTLNNQAANIQPSRVLGLSAVMDIASLDNSNLSEASYLANDDSNATNYFAGDFINGTPQLVSYPASGAMSVTSNPQTHQVVIPTRNGWVNVGTFSGSNPTPTFESYDLMQGGAPLLPCADHADIDLNQTVYVTDAFFCQDPDASMQTRIFEASLQNVSDGHLLSPLNVLDLSRLHVNEIYDMALMQNGSMG